MAPTAVSPLTKYPCDTQEEEDPSYGAAPISNLAGTTGDNDPDEPDSLVVGFGTIVPRWDVKVDGGRILRYFVQTESFPDPSQAQIAAKEFKDATESWNELELGVTISETTEAVNANFDLVYKANPNYGGEKNTLAKAFFPHETNQDVIVFKKAFDHTSIMKNVFQHEIGHILGLRHEFAITGDATKEIKPEKHAAVQYLSNNYNSIMSYCFPPKMQDSDRDQTIQFYQLPNGFMVNGSPVTDYQAQVRRGNR